jgi:4-amino-4-deoxy-L-arabinose transferase-like glycosyltransferase
MTIEELVGALKRLGGSSLVVFTVTAVTRLAALLRLLPEHEWINFYPLNEPSHIAWAMVSGFGYSAPWPNTPIAATAQQPPVFPFLLASIFKVAGAYSLTSLWIAVSLNALFSAMTAVMILRLGKRDFGDWVGILAAWAWALWLYEAIVSIRLWESGLTALLLMLALWWLPSLTSARPWRWCLFGVLAGIAAQTNTTMLAMFPCFYAWVWLHSRKQSRIAMRWLYISAGIFVLTLVPWTMRNYRAFGRLMPLRDNFGLELWIGNRAGADEAHQYPSAFPLIDPTEYNQLGELRFMELKQSQAFEFISQHPAEFLRLSCRRILRFWTEPKNSWWFAVSLLAWIGLALALRRDPWVALPYALVMLLFPLVYYITHTFPTYRHPIEPVVILLAAFVLQKSLTIRGLARRSV